MAASRATALAVALALAVAPAAPAHAADDEDARRPLLEVAGPNAKARSAALDDTWPADAVPGSLLVTTSSAAAAESVARQAAASLARGDSQLSGVVGSLLSEGIAHVQVPPGREAAAARLLRRMAGVVSVEPDRVREFFAEPNDPLYVNGSQWAHGLTNIKQAWDIITDASSVKVAVLDSGINANHPDLAGRVAEQWNLSSGSAKSASGQNDACLQIGGHGTPVAGVIGAVGDNSIGVAGVAWDVRLIDIRVAQACSGPTDSVAIAAINHAVKRSAKVINMSFGGIQRSCPTALQKAINDARGSGVTLVAASGNSEIGFYAGEPAVPASCKGVISVGAVGQTGSHAPYSTTNKWVDLVAPGGGPGGIRTTSADGGYSSVQGTSFAAPYVAGLVALVRAHTPGLSLPKIEGLLEQTAQDKGPTGRDSTYGWGLVQAGAALTMLDTNAGAIKNTAANPDFPAGDVPPPLRVSAGAASTEVIAQAAAVSQRLFEAGGAAHAVIARSDDYADALAGSSLGYGFGPVLFTSRTGPLAERTRNELQRVLPPGGLVYLMGGNAALPDTLEGELKALGFNPKRIAGAAREETAALTAVEVQARVGALGGSAPPVAILATRGNWPDAVAAGSLGSYFGIPILLTSVDSLHPVTAQRLSDLKPMLLYVVGGSAAISHQTLVAAATAAGVSDSQVVRLAGPARDATAVAVAEEMQDLLSSMIPASPPAMAVAGSLRHPHGYAHVLSGSAIIGRHSGIFVPVDLQEGQSSLTPITQSYLCGLVASRPDSVLAGGPDVISETTAGEMASRIAGVGC